MTVEQYVAAYIGDCPHCGRAPYGNGSIRFAIERTVHGHLMRCPCGFSWLRRRTWDVEDHVQIGRSNFAPPSLPHLPRAGHVSLRSGPVPVRAVADQRFVPATAPRPGQPMAGI
jgi:hypothetical protein